jgi:hypothetical protein
MFKLPSHRARSSRALAAGLAIFAISMLAGAPRAFAQGPACNGDRASNSCLTIAALPPYWVASNVTVGIDVAMPAYYAREVLDCGPTFRSQLWGDDGGGSADDRIGSVWVTDGWPIADANGISAEFGLNGILTNDMNEDDGEDELYARISFYDCHTGETRFFRTGTIHSEFRWWH